MIDGVKMQLEQTYNPNTVYMRIGAEKGVKELVKRFYDYMESLDEAKGIRKMHAEDMTEIRETFYWFLSGWMNGPNLYFEKRGHPMLRKRHFPFAIGETEREAWLLCMNKALADMDIDQDLKEILGERFAMVAEHMRNRE